MSVCIHTCIHTQRECINIHKKLHTLEYGIFTDTKSGIKNKNNQSKQSLP